MPPSTKEDKTDSSRKRKTANSASANSAGSKTKGCTLYQELTQREEKEALSRSNSEDAKQFASVCDQMKVILRKIKEAKNAEKTSEINEYKIQISMLFLTLKKLNRLDKLRLRNSRDLTMTAKQRVDSFHLQLQNLKYEVMHLQKEVTKCYEFKSLDQDFELVPVEEFYKAAPAEISKPEETKDDEHAQRKARLEWEMEQRKMLAKREKEEEGIRNSVEKHIREKEEKLFNLKPRLTTILQATRPLQTYLHLPLEEEKAQLNLSKYLPSALFILFSQINAYRRATDKRLKIDIRGDIEEAKCFFSKLSGTNDDSEDEEESDKPEAEEEDEGQGTSKRIRTSSSSALKTAKGADTTGKFFETHPLSVELIVLNRGGNEISVTFKYVVELRIVLAKVGLDLNKENSNLGEQEVLQQNALLSHLIGRDSGEKSPDLSSIFRLKKAGLTAIPESVMEEAGLPYVWAQNLAGLDFPEEIQDNSADAECFTTPRRQVCISKVEDIINAIRGRLEARLSLQKQISRLDKMKTTNTELSIPEPFCDSFPSRILSRIRNWGVVEYEQYCNLEVTRHLEPLVDRNDFIYRLQLDRDPAKLIALIVVKPDYPRTHPIFCLNLHWNGEYNIHNSEHMRALEREVNTGFINAFNSEETAAYNANVLSLQIQRLMSCLDVMLEAWNATMEDTKQLDFQREKTFLQPVRGRDRRLPLSYDPKKQIFSQ